MKYGLLVTLSNSHISARGRRFESSVGCLNPCTCSCSTYIIENIKVKKESKVRKKRKRRQKVGKKNGVKKQKRGKEVSLRYGIEIENEIK